VRATPAAPSAPGPGGAGAARVRNRCRRCSQWAAARPTFRPTHPTAGRRHTPLTVSRSGSQLARPATSLRRSALDPVGLGDTASHAHRPPVARVGAPQTGSCVWPYRILTGHESSDVPLCTDGSRLAGGDVIGVRGGDARPRDQSNKLAPTPLSCRTIIGSPCALAGLGVGGSDGGGVCCQFQRSDSDGRRENALPPWVDDERDDAGDLRWRKALPPCADADFGLDADRAGIGDDAEPPEASRHPLALSLPDGTVTKRKLPWRLPCLEVCGVAGGSTRPVPQSHKLVKEPKELRPPFTDGSGDTHGVAGGDARLADQSHHESLLLGAGGTSSAGAAATATSSAGASSGGGSAAGADALAPIF